MCGACDFEDNGCGWTDTSSGTWAWSRETASAITDPNGPEGDHTCGDKNCELSVNIL